MVEMITQQAWRHFELFEKVHLKVLLSDRDLDQ